MAEAPGSEDRQGTSPHPFAEQAHRPHGREKWLWLRKGSTAGSCRFQFGGAASGSSATDSNAPRTADASVSSEAARAFRRRPLTNAWYCAIHETAQTNRRSSYGETRAVSQMTLRWLLLFRKNEWVHRAHELQVNAHTCPNHALLLVVSEDRSELPRASVDVAISLERQAPNPRATNALEEDGTSLPAVLVIRTVGVIFDDKITLAPTTTRCVFIIASVLASPTAWPHLGGVTCYDLEELRWASEQGEPLAERVLGMRFMRECS